MKNKIDVNHCYTEDVQGFWEEFWSNLDGLGHVTQYNDPDSKSKILQENHFILWNKGVLSNELQKKVDTNGNLYFKYKNIRLSSDSMINSFRYKSLPFNLKNEMQKNGNNYKIFQENYLKKSFTIGGMIIFPKHSQSLNQRRGTDTKIKDRFDLTLECIRRYYAHDDCDNPLKDVLIEDNDYFRLFGDFKGFIDFFLLQDWVDENYQVKFMLDFDDFCRSPLPQSYDEYMSLYNKQLNLVEKRNNRIEKFIVKNNY